MRWTSDSPDIGDTRKREGFLLFPKTINGETRWLEHARWEECFGSSMPLDHPDMTDWKRECVTDPMLMSLEWKDFRWLPPNTPEGAAAKPDPPYKRPQSEETDEEGTKVRVSKEQLRQIGVGDRFAANGYDFEIVDETDSHWMCQVK